MKLMVEETQTPGRKRVGGRENKGNLEGGTDEYLEEKTPVEIIEERKQRLRTSRMDTRLRTPVPRRRREDGWEKQGQVRTGETTNILQRKHQLKSLREKKQRIRTSRMDTRLRTPAPRRKGWAGGKRRQLRIELGKDEDARVNLMGNAPDEKR